MQALSGRNVPFGTPIRYRGFPQEPWRAGEMFEVKGADLMFLCDTPLELYAEVEIMLPAKVQTMEREASLNLLCSGRVVRRLLANWPEVRSALVVRITICHIAPENSGANAA